MLAREDSVQSLVSRSLLLATALKLQLTISRGCTSCSFILRQRSMYFRRWTILGEASWFFAHPCFAASELFFVIICERGLLWVASSPGI